MLEKELIQLGLTEKEAKIYLALLELGLESVNRIAKKSQVNRATTYFVLESLSRRKLASKLEKDKTTYYSPEPPEQLINILKKQEAEIKQKVQNFQTLLPQLRGVYNLAENKPVVRFFEGREGLRAIQEDFLSSNDREVEAAYALDDVRKVFKPYEREEYSNRKKEKRILSRAIYVSEETTRPHEELSISFRVPKDQFPITADLTIYDNKVAIASLRGNLSGVIIENSEIANTLRSIFRLAYAKAKELHEKSKF